MIYAEKKSFTISSNFGSKMSYFAWTTSQETLWPSVRLHDTQEKRIIVLVRLWSDF